MTTGQTMPRTCGQHRATKRRAVLRSTVAPVIVCASGGTLDHGGFGVPSQRSEVVSEQQRRELDERGFFFTDVLFTASEIESVRSECIRLYHASIEEIPESNRAHRSK